MKRILFFISFSVGLYFSVLSIFTGKTMLDYAIEKMPKVTVKPISVESLQDRATLQFFVTFVYVDEAKEKGKFIKILTDGEKYYFPLSSGNWIVIFDNKMGDESYISFETQTVYEVKEKGLKPVAYDYLTINKAKVRWKNTNTLLELIIN